MEVTLEREPPEGQPCAKRPALSGAVIPVPDSSQDPVPATVVTPTMVAEAQWLYANGQAQVQVGTAVLQAATAQAAALATCVEPPLAS